MTEQSTAKAGMFSNGASQPTRMLSLWQQLNVQLEQPQRCKLIAGGSLLSLAGSGLIKQNDEFVLLSQKLAFDYLLGTPPLPLPLQLPKAGFSLKISRSTNSSSSPVYKTFCFACSSRHSSPPADRASRRAPGAALRPWPLWRPGACLFLEGSVARSLS